MDLHCFANLSEKYVFTHRKEDDGRWLSNNSKWPITLICFHILLDSLEPDISGVVEEFVCYVVHKIRNRSACIWKAGLAILAASFAALTAVVVYLHDWASDATAKLTVRARPCTVNAGEISLSWLHFMFNIADAQDAACYVISSSISWTNLCATLHTILNLQANMRSRPVHYLKRTCVLTPNGVSQTKLRSLIRALYQKNMRSLTHNVL